ncbi:MAG: hypothetical protein WAQ08_19465 [Aquabacterium sp.]|jgi:hypothetical protein|uniref:hypothetical protein n=1 Tax=Aquabacterium sp. TaxID=1872578 RepID=UPI003BAF4A53
MSKKSTAPQPDTAEASNAIEWHEEWLSPEQVIRLKSLQVRKKLDAGAISRYRDMTKAGKVPPPIKVAEVKKAGVIQHYLVDGWHRWEAGAVVTGHDVDGNPVMDLHGMPGPGGTLVKVLCAPMSMKDATWEAAQANLDHGVPLKSTELVAVFKAFVRAGKHRTRKGYRSYREMGTVLGIAKSTLGRWMHKHFPKIAANIGGNDGAAPGGLRDAPELPSPADEVVSEVKRIRAIALSLPPGEKRRVSDALQELLADLGKLPVMEDANAF